MVRLRRLSRVRKLSIALPLDLAGWVQERVAAGHYASVSEVIREALRHWRAGQPELPPPLRSLCENIGVDSLWVAGRMLGCSFAAEFGEKQREINARYAAFCELQLELQMLIDNTARLFSLGINIDAEDMATLIRRGRLLYQRS
jgi:putative addiction module CopG family antidote